MVAGICDGFSASGFFPHRQTPEFPEFAPKSPELADLLFSAFVDLILKSLSADESLAGMSDGICANVPSVE